MKSTKNCNGTKSCSKKNSAGKSAKKARSSQESESDPSGSYTGNPIGWGIDALPVQDANDL